MVYMFKVYALVAFGVFGLTGTFILTLIAWEQAKQYSAARQAMDRITKRTRLANHSRFRETHREITTATFSMPRELSSLQLALSMHLDGERGREHRWRNE